MIRIKDCLINERDVLYIEKYGFFEIRVHMKNHEGDGLIFTYADSEIRDAAFENIDSYGRD